MEIYYDHPMKMKMKRKDLDDEFSDFSLSAPPTKIRRLDAELPPIIEEVEDEPAVPIAFEQAPTDPSFGSNARTSGLVIEELPSVPESEERAIVLFKPMNTPLVHSPSNFKVDRQLINSFRSQVLWGNQANAFRPTGNEGNGEEDSSSTKECLAVVPWVPSQISSAQREEAFGQADTCDMMDTEDIEGVTMDIEDSSANAEPRMAVEAGAVNVNEGLHQWQQQHCMMTQLPQNTSTPVVWYQ